MLIRSNFRKTILLLLGITLFATIQLTASDTQSTYKLYVTTDQLVLNSDGIFVDCKDFGLVSVHHLSYMGDGIYLAGWERECPKHGKYCSNCGGCHPNNTCQYRCKCPPRRALDVQHFILD